MEGLKNKNFKPILSILGIAIIYFVLGRISLTFIIKPENISVIWPLSGIFLSAILLTSKRYRPILIIVLFLTDLFVEYLSGSSISMSIIYAFALTMDATLSAWLLNYFIKKAISFNSIKDVILFVLLAVILSNAIAASIAAIAPHFMLGSSYIESWLWWWTSDAIGNLLITPLVISWSVNIKGSLRNVKLKQVIEVIALFVLMGSVNYFAYSYFNLYDYFSNLALYFTFPFLIWAALRFGVRGVTFATLCISALYLYLVLFGQHVFIDTSAKLTLVLHTQLYLAIISISALILAAAITERSKIQKDKEKANDKYQQLINELHEGLAIVDLKEDFVFVNPAFQKMIDYTADELLGRNLKEFTPTADFSEIILETEKRKQGFVSSYISKLINKKGEIKGVNVSASPWRNEAGEIIGSIALVMDITNQLKASEELKLRYNFEKHIFNISSRFVNPENFDEKVNASLKDIGMLANAKSTFIVTFDYKNHHCLFDFFWNKPGLSDPQLFDPCPLSVFSSGITQLKTKEHFYIKSTKELKNELEPLKAYFEKNNIENLMGFPLYVGAELYGFLGIQNISKENLWTKNEFILLRSAGEILCNSVQRKLNEDHIKKLNIMLSEKIQENEQVLYVTSHDIRSPLVNIIGFTKELNKSMDELNEYLSKEIISAEDRENINYLLREDIPEVLKFINAGGVKIDKLLNSLLRLSRLGRVPLELTMVNTKIIVQEIIESMEYQIQTFKIDVSVSNLPEMVTDRNLFTQIMTNLIDNAVKYHDENKKSVLFIGSEINDNKIVFTVKDNGIGIANDKKDRVFEIFNRLNPEKTEGEGIGLTIIKKAVDRLDGTLFLESEFGIGCTFTIEFNKI